MCFMQSYDSFVILRLDSPNIWNKFHNIKTVEFFMLLQYFSLYCIPPSEQSLHVARMLVEFYRTFYFMFSCSHYKLYFCHYLIYCKLKYMRLTCCKALINLHYMDIYTSSSYIIFTVHPFIQHGTFKLISMSSNAGHNVVYIFTHF